jgi:hypothetical protein
MPEFSADRPDRLKKIEAGHPLIDSLEIGVV